MNTYYTILFTPIRAAINEQISIALLLIDDNKMLFEYSNKKISFLKKLIPSEAVNLIKQYLNGIVKEIESFQKEKLDKSKLFEKTTSEYSNYSEEYLSYLHTFSNNLITFSKPKRIDIVANENNYKLLYEKFVSNELLANIEKESINKIEESQRILYSKLNQKVNLNVDIDKIKIPSIKSPKVFLPDNINIIGQNGTYFSGQFIDFDKRSNYLKADLTYYSNFVNEINDNGTNVIIGNEPDSNTQNNHEYWKYIKDYNKIKLITTDELEWIEEYIEDNDVKPLFDIVLD